MPETVVGEIADAMVECSLSLLRVVFLLSSSPSPTRIGFGVFPLNLFATITVCKLPDFFLGSRLVVVRSRASSDESRVRASGYHGSQQHQRPFAQSLLVDNKKINDEDGKNGASRPVAVAFVHVGVSRWQLC